MNHLKYLKLWENFEYKKEDVIFTNSKISNPKLKESMGEYSEDIKEKDGKRHTPKGKSYWNHNGAYQKEYEKLSEELVPFQGEADTIHGEVLRAMGNFYYDYFNNGNGNVAESDYYTEDETCFNCDGMGEVEVDDGYGETEYEVCDDCGGSGSYDEEIEGDIELTNHYEKQYQTIYNFLKSNNFSTESLERMRDFIEKGSQGDDVAYEIYNNVVDDIMYAVLNTENKPMNK